MSVGEGSKGDVMGKYDPLRRRLRRSNTVEVELSFAEIERIIGAMLPNGAARPQWWANAVQPDQRQIQQAAWRDAGYEAFLVAGAEKVRFRRVVEGHPAQAARG